VSGVPPPLHLQRSFTLKSQGGLLRVLLTDCLVGEAFTPTPGAVVPPLNAFKAIWDTGASHSVITLAVARACGLKPIGKTIVHGVGGEHICNQYLVNIRLPNRVGFQNVRVTEGILKGGNNGDVLIGMDIITTGDFAVTNFGGVTTFSFRHPSCAAIDYVQQHNSKMALGSKDGKKK
jgi:hypothetical protein